ncbi:hypothetical protein MNV49_007054, partial [Pseudohyphozyma bogoriensis]
MAYFRHGRLELPEYSSIGPPSEAPLTSTSRNELFRQDHGLDWATQRKSYCLELTHYITTGHLNPDYHRGLLTGSWLPFLSLDTLRALTPELRRANEEWTAAVRLDETAPREID